MHYKHTTQVPNFIFDTCLSDLAESELKILLIIIRLTYGWIIKATGKRKQRDRISGIQFRQKTGLSKRVITKAVKSLIQKQLIRVTDFDGNELLKSSERKGKSYMYYEPYQPVQSSVKIGTQKLTEPTCNYYPYKVKYQKPERTNRTRAFNGHIGTIINKRTFL